MATGKPSQHPSAVTSTTPPQRQREILLECLGRLMAVARGRGDTASLEDVATVTALSGEWWHRRLPWVRGAETALAATLYEEGAPDEGPRWEDAETKVKARFMARAERVLAVLSKDPEAAEASVVSPSANNPPHVREPHVAWSRGRAAGIEAAAREATEALIEAGEDPRAADSLRDRLLALKEAPAPKKSAKGSAAPEDRHARLVQWVLEVHDADQRPDVFGGSWPAHALADRHDGLLRWGVFNVEGLGDTEPKAVFSTEELAYEWLRAKRAAGEASEYHQVFPYVATFWFRNEDLPEELERVEEPSSSEAAEVLPATAAPSTATLQPLIAVPPPPSAEYPRSAAELLLRAGVRLERAAAGLLTAYEELRLGYQEVQRAREGLGGELRASTVSLGAVLSVRATEARARAEALRAYAQELEVWAGKAHASAALPGECTTPVPAGACKVCSRPLLTEEARGRGWHLNCPDEGATAALAAGEGGAA